MKCFKVKTDNAIIQVKFANNYIGSNWFFNLKKGQVIFGVLNKSGIEMFNNDIIFSSLYFDEVDCQDYRYDIEWFENRQSSNHVELFTKRYGNPIKDPYVCP